MGMNNMAMIILIGGAVLIGATFLLAPKKDDEKTKSREVRNGAPPPTELTGQEEIGKDTQGQTRLRAARPDIDMESEPHMASVQAL